MNVISYSCNCNCSDNLVEGIERVTHIVIKKINNFMIIWNNQQTNK